MIFCDRPLLANTTTAAITRIVAASTVEIGVPPCARPIVLHALESARNSVTEQTARIASLSRAEVGARYPGLTNRDVQVIVDYALESRPTLSQPVTVTAERAVYATPARNIATSSTYLSVELAPDDAEQRLDETKFLQTLFDVGAQVRGYKPANVWRKTPSSLNLLCLRRTSPALNPRRQQLAMDVITDLEPSFPATLALGGIRIFNPGASKTPK